MKLTTLSCIAALALAACGGSPASPSSTPPAAQLETSTTAASLPPSTTQGPAETTPEPDSASDTPGEVDLVTYVAAIEDALAGTVYEGQALEAPEVFLATGALFCEQLDGGMTADEVLVTYVEALTGGPVDDAPDEELAVAGGILGVGVVTLCPAHLDTVAAST